MKKRRLLVRVIPTACLALLLSMAISSNKQSGEQQKSDVGMEQMVGTMAETNVSPAAYDIEDTYVKSKPETTMYSSNQNPAVAKKIDVKENLSKVKATSGTDKNKVSPIGDTVTGIGTVSQSKVALNTSLVGYDPSRITRVTDVADLHSAHNYDDDEDYMWEYQKAGAPAIKVTFDQETCTESGYDYIYLYNSKDELVGTYTGTQLQGKSITLFGDMIKIRLCSDSSNTEYGFAVTQVEESTDYEEYNLVYQELPKVWYEGDTDNRTLKYERKYIEEGQVTSEDLTGSVYFKWQAITDTEAMDIKLEDTQLSLSAKMEGTESGRIKVYETGTDTLVYTSPGLNFSVEPAITIDGDTQYKILVNQLSTIKLGTFTVRGKTVYPSITKVVSSDSSKVAYVPNGLKGGYNFTILGVNQGTSTITVSYTIKDGVNILSYDRIFNITCDQANYDVFRTPVSRLWADQLVPTQTAIYDITLNKYYFDNNNISQCEIDSNLTDYTIEVEPSETNKALIKTSVNGNRISIQALAIGYGEIKFNLKKDGDYVTSFTQSFTISNDSYIFEYNGPNTLYPSQTVPGPTLIHFTYKDGTVNEQTVENAIITCDAAADDPLTYSDNVITANQFTSYQYIGFTCEYNNQKWYLYRGFYVNNPYIICKGKLYKNDTVKLSLSDYPVYEEDCTVTWSVKNNYSDESTWASIQSNADRTATLSCIDTGYVEVTATIKKGEKLLCTVKKVYEIQNSIKEMLLPDSPLMRVNETCTITGHDYKINNSYYNTTITSVESDNTDIVEVVNTRRISGEDYNSFTITLQGKQIGTATIIVNYTYINEDGIPVQGKDIITAGVEGNNYSYDWDMNNVPVIPGASIPLSTKLVESGYNEDGFITKTDVIPSEVTYEIISNPNECASIEGDRLIFNTNAQANSTVVLQANATYHGVMYKSEYKSFTVQSGYSDIKGITSDLNSIRLGEEKTLSPELYLYDKDNVGGKKIGNVEFKWEDSNQNGSYVSDLTNEYFSAKGMSITGKKLGRMKAVIVACYQDERGTSITYKKEVIVQIIPSDIPNLPVGQRGTVKMPSNYFMIAPDTTGTYMISASEEMRTPLIELYDSDWNLIDAYSKPSSAYKGYLSVPVSLEEGKIYFIGASSTERDEGWDWAPYTICVDPGMAPKALSLCNITMSAQKFTYDGEVKNPTIVIKDGDKTLEEETDYVVYRRGNNINSGSFNLEINGIGNYSGSIVKTCSINRLSLTDTMVQLTKDKVVFNGKMQRPEVTVKNGEKTLKSGTDYTILYQKDYTAAGEYKVTITGEGNYKGTIIKDYKIDNDFTKCFVTLKNSVIYNGTVQNPSIVVKAKKEDTTPLKIGKDYSISASGNLKDPGKYTITITGIGDYYGKLSVTYTINKAQKTLAFTTNLVTKKYGNTPFTIALKAGSVQTVKYSSSDTKVAVVDSKGKVTIVGGGKTTITATYAGNTYYNAAKATYSLIVNKINNSITAANVIKTSSSKAQSFVLKATNKGKAALSYSSNNKAVSVKSGKVTVAKNFVGKVLITIKSAANSSYNAATKSISITVNPAGTKVTSLKKQGKNKFLLKWNKNAMVSGYEIQYATKKNFSKAVTKVINKPGTTNFTAGNLKKKTTYYARVRTYKTVGKVKYYSGWSNISYVKIN